MSSKPGRIRSRKAGELNKGPFAKFINRRNKVSKKIIETIKPKTNTTVKK